MNDSDEKSEVTISASMGESTDGITAPVYEPAIPLFPESVDNIKPIELPASNPSVIPANAEGIGIVEVPKSVMNQELTLEEIKYLENYRKEHINDPAYPIMHWVDHIGGKLYVKIGDQEFKEISASEALESFKDNPLFLAELNNLINGKIESINIDDIKDATQQKSNGL